MDIFGGFSYVSSSQNQAQPQANAQPAQNIYQQRQDAEQNYRWTIFNQPTMFKVVSNKSKNKKQSNPFDSNSSIVEKETCLVILKEKLCRIYEQTYDQPQTLQQQNAMHPANEISIQVHGILGIINLEGFNHLVVVTNASKVASIFEKPVYEITEVKFLRFYSSQTTVPQRVLDHMQKLENLLKTQNFYFSNDLDLTQSVQNIKIHGKRKISRDKRYVWNHNIQKDFSFQQVQPEWTINIIQGYCSSQVISYLGHDLNLFFISRRRYLMGGTRFNSRGLDDEGNAANCVETEICIEYAYLQMLFSHVQIRGSMPLFWTQKPNKQKISFLKVSHNQLRQAFQLHFDDLISSYKRVVMLNLLSQEKEGERSLTEKVNNLLLEQKFDKVKKFDYDFHKQTEGDNFIAALDKLGKALEQLVCGTLGFFCSNGQTRAMDLQKGVFRTNCLDCLDRTNVTQASLSQKILQQILQQLYRAIHEQNPSVGSNLLNEVADIEKIFKRMWTENGDKLSMQYTNSASNIKGVIETGRQGITGKLALMMIGMQRYIANNFTDEQKHEAIQILLNKSVNQKAYGIQKEINQLMSSEHIKSQTETFTNVRIATMTWNLAGKAPPASMLSGKSKIDDLLVPNQVNQLKETIPEFDFFNDMQANKSFNQPDNDEIQKGADIYVIGLQEMVNLEVIGSLMCHKDVERMHAWETIFKQNLNTKMPSKNFTLVARKVMFGCFIMMFVSSTHLDSIKQVATCKVKSGVAGIAANKGSTAIRFNIDDTGFMFMNCHLTSGQSQADQRQEDLKHCYRESIDHFREQLSMDQSINSSINAPSFNSNTEGGASSGGHPQQILFGDMNFRVDLPYELAVQYASNNMIKELADEDQLNKFMSQLTHPLFQRFREGPLNFLPTFKYDKDSNQYDTSKKMRVPSWTDRVLYSPHNCNLIYYGRREHLFSDHRPVLAIFDIKTKKVNRKLLEQIQNEKIAQLQARIQMPNYESASSQPFLQSSAEQSVLSQLLQSSTRSSQIEQSQSLQVFLNNNDPQPAIKNTHEIEPLISFEQKDLKEVEQATMPRMTERTQKINDFKMQFGLSQPQPTIQTQPMEQKSQQDDQFVQLDQFDQFVMVAAPQSPIKADYFLNAAANLQSERENNFGNVEGPSRRTAQKVTGANNALGLQDSNYVPIDNYFNMLDSHNSDQKATIFEQTDQLQEFFN